MLSRGPRLSAKQREKRRRRAAGLSWAVRVLGLGAGVGRVRGEGEKRARGGKDWASADWAIRPRAGVSLPFSFFYLLLQNFSKENFEHKQ